MISYLHGKPLVVSEELIVVCNGVGYGVRVTNQVLQQSSHEDSITLYIYTHVKEDALDLYGFTTLNEKELFKLLISVSGVGPTTAINILNKGAQEIITGIQNADVKFFTSVKRVGKKAAQKIIIDLKSKLGGMEDLDLTPMDQKQTDVVAALTAIGFGEDDVSGILKKIDMSELTLEQSVQAALKELGKNK